MPRTIFIILIILTYLSILGACLDGNVQDAIERKKRKRRIEELLRKVRGEE